MVTMEYVVSLNYTNNVNS